MQPEFDNPSTPSAGFTPVTPVGDSPLLSLVPPIQQGDAVRHPDPLAQRSTEQQPLPTSAQIPVAPVRRRMPVTPLIQLPGGAPLAAAMAIAPIIPGQSMQPQPLAPNTWAGPAPYGVQPTTFPFQSAPGFQMQPQYPMYGLPPLPMQTYVAYITLMTQPPQMQPYFHPGFQQPGFQQPFMQQPYPQQYMPQPYPQQQYPQQPWQSPQPWGNWPQPGQF